MRNIQSMFTKYLNLDHISKYWQHTYIFYYTIYILDNTDIQLFTNYNEGVINKYVGPLYVNVIDNEGNFIDNEINITPSIIEDPCPQPESTDCGCDTIDDDEAIKLYINKTDTNCGDVGCSGINDIIFDGTNNLYYFQYEINNPFGKRTQYIKKRVFLRNLPFYLSPSSVISASPLRRTSATPKHCKIQRFVQNVHSYMHASEVNAADPHQNIVKYNVLW